MRYFTIQELTRSAKAEQLGIRNETTPEIESNLIALVSAVLDPLRERWGKPIRVSSGYRCKALNDRLPNASKTSQHLKGEAADIYAGSRKENAQLGRLIVQMGAFDQVIFEQCNRECTEADWIHVSWKRVGTNRRDVRCNVKGSKRYETRTL